MKWTDDELKVAKKILENGGSYLTVANTMNKSHSCVAKSLKKLGYNSGFKKNSKKGVTKYADIDWYWVQTQYDLGLSYRDLINKLEITSRSINWAISNGKLKLRSASDGLTLAWEKGKFKKSDAVGLRRYRQLCEFKFNVYHFPSKFDLSLVDNYGWYKAKNRGDNQNGVSRDHMYSIKEGFLNNVDPYYISHPANCRLMRHVDNNVKKTKSSITLEELMHRIETWS